MAYVYGNPRYGVSANFRDAGEDTGGSKTINYLNLAVGGESSGYTPAQLQTFMAGVSTLTNKTMSGLRMTAERPIEDEDATAQ